MSGSIVFGNSNGAISIAGGNAPAISTTGNSGEVVVFSNTPQTGGGSTLSSYQQAVIAGTYTGTEAKFYADAGTSASIYPIEDLPPLP